MNRRVRLTMAVVVLACAALFSCTAGVERIEVKIGGQTFRVEVARTEEQKRLGLMHRETIGPREGMIFVYRTDQHLAFWMKDTSVPLTLLFLSKDGRIEQIEELKPLSMKSVISERAVRYALELPQGEAEKLGVKVGDRVVLPERFP